MLRPRLAPALALLVLACGDPPDTTGFMSPETTSGGGPTSFGDSTTGTPTSSSTTGDPTTTTTTDPLTTSSSTTTTSSSTTTATTTTATTEAPPACGDGTLDDGEVCDDGNGSDGDYCLSNCTAGHAILLLVGRGDDPAAVVTFSPGAGWDVADATYDFSAAELESTPDGALAVIRRAGADPDAKDELWFTRWQQPMPDLLLDAEPVGEFGFTLDAPSIACVPDTVTLAFLGTDNKHYTALFNYTDEQWAPFIPLPASDLAVQAFGPSAATVAPAQLATHAVYAGDDDRVYVARKPQWDAAWEASVQASPPAVLDTVPPAAIVLANGDLVIAYARKSDNRIGLALRSAADNTWTLEATVDPAATTTSPISLLVDDAGAFLIAWRHTTNAGISLATGTAHDAWDPPVTVEVPADSTAPLLVPGALGASAELFYASGGAVRHTRIVGDELELTDVPGIADATALAAARVQLAP
jgi:cysteine-rich repeat protein